MRKLWLELALVFVSLAAIGGLATAYVNHSGWTLYYGDAEAHLDIARRIIDSRKPGYDQIGTVWLPLPHVLMLPFVRNDRLWRSGWPGAIPSSACFVCAGMFPLRGHPTPRGRIVGRCPGVAGAAGSQSESFVLASHSYDRDGSSGGLMALLYFTVLFRETQSFAAVIGAGVASIAASLARYEGWVVIPFVAIYFLIAGRKTGSVTAAALRHHRRARPRSTGSPTIGGSIPIRWNFTTDPTPP